MRCIEDHLPESILDVATGGETLREIDRPALFPQPVEHLDELAVCLVVQLVFREALDEHVGLVVAVEGPVILIEAAEGHQTPVIHLNCLHVQVLKGLFGHLRAVLLQSVEQVAVQMSLVARLVAVASRHDF